MPACGAPRHDGVEQVGDRLAGVICHYRLHGHQLVSSRVTDVDHPKNCLQAVSCYDRAVVQETLLAVHNQQVVKLQVWIPHGTFIGEAEGQQREEGRRRDHVAIPQRGRHPAVQVRGMKIPDRGREPSDQLS